MYTACVDAHHAYTAYTRRLRRIHACVRACVRAQDLRHIADHSVEGDRCDGVDPEPGAALGLEALSALSPKPLSAVGLKASSAVGLQCIDVLGANKTKTHACAHQNVHAMRTRGHLRNTSRRSMSISRANTT